MPSVSKKQHNFMEAIAHSPSFAKKVGVPQKVGQDFANADKGRKFSKGGDTMATKMDPRVLQMLMASKQAQMGRRAPMAAPAAAPMAGGMKKGGMAAFEKSGKDVEKKGMKEGSKADMALDKKQMMMKSGGMPMVMKDGKKVPAFAADGKGAMKHGGSVKKMNMGGMAYAKGGSASSRADGIATKGKTKGTFVKMKMGGKAC